ncbi:MAG: alkaline phosphatase [Myxococcota bacterium]|jgi:alkaline phosphatase
MFQARYTSPMLTLLLSCLAHAGPAVVLVIGDGAGPAQLELASEAAHGRIDALDLYSLPHRGRVWTASLDGLTDSAAAATALASGVATRNRRIGVDEAGTELATLLDVARDAGLSIGVVSTTALTHATPAAFTAHARRRTDTPRIASEQVAARLDVALGGGAGHYDLDAIERSGARLVTDAAQLGAHTPRRGEPLWGLFAADHLPWVYDRPATIPSLPQMAVAALEQLDTNPDGFFLLIEAGRIDHACHRRDAERVIPETLELDAAVTAVREWGAGRDLTLVVTADHETGGMRLAPGRLGEDLEVGWEWGDHTNRPVDLFADGPGTADLHGRSLHHVDVHAALRAALGDPAAPPRFHALPDGELTDLPWVVPAPAAVFRVHSLRIGAAPHALAIGVAGWFRTSRDGIVVLVDHEPGGGSFAGTNPLSESLAAVRVPWPPGFAPDLAVGSLAASPRPIGLGTDDRSRAGGRRADGTKLDAVVVFAEETRHVEHMITPPPADIGFEAWLPWTEIWDDGIPADGAALSLWALELRTDDGEVTDARPLGPPVRLAVDATGKVRVPGGETATQSGR